MAIIRSKDNKKIDFRETILAFSIFNLTFIWLMYFVIELYRCRAIEKTSAIMEGAGAWEKANIVRQAQQDLEKKAEKLKKLQDENPSALPYLEVIREKVKNVEA